VGEPRPLTKEARDQVVENSRDAFEGSALMLPNGCPVALAERSYWDVRRYEATVRDLEKRLEECTEDVKRLTAANKRLATFAATRNCERILAGEPVCAGRAGWDLDTVDSPWCVPCLARRALAASPTPAGGPGEGW
jgi:hypothetical protein